MEWNNLSIEQKNTYIALLTGMGIPNDQHMSYYYNQILNK